MKMHAIRVILSLCFVSSALCSAGQGSARVYSEQLAQLHAKCRSYLSSAKTVNLGTRAALDLQENIHATTKLVHRLDEQGRA